MNSPYVGERPIVMSSPHVVFGKHARLCREYVLQCIAIKQQHHILNFAHTYVW